MKKILLAALAIFLTACAAPQTVEPTPTATFTPLPTPTLTPTPTPDPVIDSLKNKFRNAGYSFETLEDVPNVRFDNGIWHFTNQNGEDVVMNNVELDQRVQVSRLGTLQIWNKENTKIEMAYDPVDNLFIFSKDLVQLDYKEKGNYIRIKSWEELRPLARKVELLSPDFPIDTYFPEPNQIYRYYDINNKRFEDKNNPGFSWDTPFGVIEDLTKRPFRYSNYVILEAGEGRSHDIYIVSQHVYNPITGGFGTLNYTFEGTNGDYSLVFGKIDNRSDTTSIIQYLLPKRNVFEEPRVDQFWPNSLAYCKELGITPNKYEELINEWLDSGEIPELLEGVPLFSLPKSMHPEHVTGR